MSETISMITEILSLSFSILTFIIAIIISTKKFELTENVQKGIMEWYEKCINVIVLLRGYISSDLQLNEEVILKLNCELYSLIEIGRFNYPNYDRKKGKGADKYEAYKGRRNLALDLLVKTYEITSTSTDELRKDKEIKIVTLKEYQKLFTSHIFEDVDPNVRIKNIEKYTGKKSNKNITLSETNFKIQNSLDNM